MKQETTQDNEQTSGKTLQMIEWVEQAQAGDQTAFHRLVDQFQTDIYRMIYYRTRSTMDAEDLTQDVFLRAYKSLKGLESPMVFKSWLYRIAVNRVRDHYRRQRIKALIGISSMDEDNFQETEEMAVPPEAADHIDRKDFWTRVKEMTKILSRMEREVFMLRFFDQLSIKEMAAAMKKNESTIKTHLYRALAKVKETSDANLLWEEL